MSPVFTLSGILHAICESHVPLASRHNIRSLHARALDCHKGSRVWLVHQARSRGRKRSRCMQVLS